MLKNIWINVWTAWSIKLCVKLKLFAFTTDSSPQILAQYSQKDNRIKIITQENQGMAVARNAGLSHVSTDYIMFVDSDDYIDNDMVEVMYNMMVQHKPDVVACDVDNILSPDITENGKIETFNQRNKTFQQFCRPTGMYKIDKNVKKQFSSVVWNKLYKTSIVKKYNIRFLPGMVHEDEFWLWAYMLHCKSYYFVEKKLYHYLYRAGSIMDQVHEDTYALDMLEQHKNIYIYTKKYKDITKYKDMYAKRFMSTVLKRKDLISPSVRLKLLETVRDYAFNYNPSEKMLNNYRALRAEIMDIPQQQVKEQKHNSKKDTAPQNDTLKIFKIITLWSKITRKNQCIYSILGIPVWKIIRAENQKTVKYYFMNIPVAGLQRQEPPSLADELQKQIQTLEQNLNRKIQDELTAIYDKSAEDFLVYHNELLERLDNLPKKMPKQK